MFLGGVYKGEDVKVSLLIVDDIYGKVAAIAALKKGKRAGQKPTVYTN